jgi:hypothetical protein
MKLSRFKALADLFGGRIERWPDAEQAAARRLAGDDPQARAVLKRAMQLDALLDDATLAVPADATARVIAATLARTRTVATPATPRHRAWRSWWPAGLLAAAALAGCATARERPQWIGLADAPARISALAAALDADGSRF